VKDLLEHDKPAALQSLWIDAGKVQFVPVIAEDNQVVGSLQMTWTGHDGNWETLPQEAVEYAQRLHDIRKEHAAAHRHSPAAYTLLAVPSLNYEFLAVGEGDETELIPIGDDPTQGWKAGTPLPAVEVLEKLRTLGEELKAQELQGADAQAPG
jgi:hypothetical protein